MIVSDTFLDQRKTLDSMDKKRFTTGGTHVMRPKMSGTPVTFVGLFFINSSDYGYNVCKP
jgi:hypothetical protein